MITSLGDVLDEDLALGGGELTWRAGPLAKGAEPLPRHRGKRLRVPRALPSGPATSAGSTAPARFAAHAIAQVEALRAEHGRGWHSLWTGDLGVALYLADCIDGGGRLPLP